MVDSRARIVLGNGSLIAYPQAGGVWSWLLQYVLGLKALGHEVLLIEEFRGTGERRRDLRLLSRFFARMKSFGTADSCAVIDYSQSDDPGTISQTAILGRSRGSVLAFLRDADVLWNLAATIREPLLSLFRRRALIDGDPGHLQVAALDWDVGIDRHEVLVTVGGKVDDPDCEVPTLGRRWLHFPAPVHLPFWTVSRRPPNAPFTSITQWTWEEVWLRERVLSVSKRDAYLRYADLPKSTGLPFELAANIGTADPGGDRARLTAGGWHLVDPHEVAPSPDAYRRYISNSLAEFCCPKPIFRELRTGWFSDRSAAYLASGRPVLAEDTGFTEWLPAGRGIVAFRGQDEAIAAARDIHDGYADHAQAARQIAEDHLDARKVLPAMVEATVR